MKKMKSILLFAACGWAVLATAHAGVSGTISVTVAPIEPNATYSSVGPPALNSVVGYQVDVKNTGKNTNNNVVFHAAVGITDAAETVTFSSAEGLVCNSEPPLTNNATQIGIACSIDTLSAGQSAPTFFIFFNTPQQVLNGTADGPGTDFVNLAYQVTFAEGKHGPKSKPANGFTTPALASPIVLGTANPQLVRSVVLASGGTFFTGNGGVAAIGDEHATKTVVPPLTSHTTVDIAETPIAGSATAPCTANVFVCYISQITIPGNFGGPFLTVRLSQRIENFQKIKTCVDNKTWRHHDDCEPDCTLEPVPIEKVVVFYVPDGSATEVIPTLDLQVAPATCTPDGDTPCLTAREVIRDAQGKPIRYEWTLISRHNGSWGMR
jgi:hypothetical protein